MSRIVSKRSSSLDAMQKAEPKTRSRKVEEQPTDRMKFTFYLDRDLHKELRRISYEKNIPIQKMLEAGLDKWLHSEGEPTSAVVKRRQEAAKEAA
jgi:hypothetical protein